MVKLGCLQKLVIIKQSINMEINKNWRITFNGGQAKVSGIDVDGVHLVKWYCDGEFIGDYELGDGNWGAYPLSLGDWKIEFWKDGEKMGEYHNDLNDAPVLIIAPKPGKRLPIEMLIKRGNELKDKYNCEVIFYFKGSEQYDLSPFKTLKMNDEYNFKLILEENYG